MVEEKKSLLRRQLEQSQQELRVTATRTSQAEADNHILHEELKRSHVELENAVSRVAVVEGERAILQEPLAQSQEELRQSRAKIQQLEAQAAEGARLRGPIEASRDKRHENFERSQCHNEALENILAPGEAHGCAPRPFFSDQFRPVWLKNTSGACVLINLASHASSTFSDTSTPSI